MKGLFWKRVLAPELLQGLQVLWLFDADVAVHPSVMPLGHLVAALMSAGASALQPVVRTMRLRGLDRGSIRVPRGPGPTSSGCGSGRATRAA